MTEEHTTGEEKSATISIDSYSTAYCHKEYCEENKKRDDDQTIDETETTKIESSVEESSEKNIVEGEGKDQIPDTKITEEANAIITNSAAPEKEIDELASWRANKKNQNEPKRNGKNMMVN